MMNRIGYCFFLGGYGVLGKMGSQSSLACFSMAHARGLHPILQTFVCLDSKKDKGNECNRKLIKIYELRFFLFLSSKET